MQVPTHRHVAELLSCQESRTLAQLPRIDNAAEILLESVDKIITICVPIH